MTTNAPRHAGDRIVQNLGAWRYLQFVLVAVIAGGLLNWLTNLPTLAAWLVGLAIGGGYFVLEKWRGVI
ncbi:hypothetical protein [Solilutibacter silvestris]|uniref:Uncharacterized protein n=1 Tax=Solilutibacter silvestris TaxID=1645665 RepID=A0A2K1PZP0_9GAMM|nr:hypothetical protein [Lysobacter silvestris]PNS08127.1 hypothetical protein Lysil_2303 [Lysobacter silvestris]